MGEWLNTRNDLSYELSGTGLRPPLDAVRPRTLACGFAHTMLHRAGAQSDRLGRGPGRPTGSGPPAAASARLSGPMLWRMDEQVLAERLITYDTSRPEGLRAAGAFIKGWLEARDIDVDDREYDGLPVVLADVGPRDGPTVIFHGHVDVVPARAGQFSPRVEGDRLIGRGAYDMKGALAALMCAMRDAAEQDAVRVRFICVPDEESEDVSRRSTDVLVAAGLRGDFALTGEPTDLHIGVQAKGVLAVRVEVTGTSAHGSTPWLGDNAILKAHDVFRRVETLPFSRESSDLFDRPSINLARILSGDAFNKVPDECTMAIDIRYLPGQDPGDILAQVRELPDLEVVRGAQRDGVE